MKIMNNKWNNKIIIIMTIMSKMIMIMKMIIIMKVMKNENEWNDNNEIMKIMIMKWIMKIMIIMKIMKWNIQ